MIKKILIATFITMFVAGLSLAAWLWSEYHRVLEQSVVTSQIDSFEIAKGASLNVIGSELRRHNININPYWFKLIAYQLKLQNRLKAGEYRLEQGLSIPDLLALFAQGKSRQYALTIPEGWTFKQLVEVIQNEPKIAKTLDYSNPQELLAHIQSDYSHPEGLFFPETYFFEKNSTDKEILLRAYTRMTTILAEEWQNRNKDLPITSPYEALILASIIEKETGQASERKQIAGVFTRRLRKGMLLQTDPTVIYGMGDRYKGNIRYKDLREYTPYNTYVINGLPPTPIALPGRAAIHAALHPAEGNALYFVSRGDGSHVFSETLRQHNNAVNKYQRKNK